METVQTVFEKINSTGKPLSAADLIRNYLLISKSPDEQQRLYDNYWINIERTVGNEFISRLTKNYLIIKTYDDVAEFKDVVSDNIIHKSHNKYRKDEKDPVISMDKSLLVEPKKIGNTDIYSEGSLSSERARVYAKQLLDIFKITNDIQILVEKKEDE